MYGQQQNGAFFGPKDQVEPSRLHEIRDINTSFLDSLHSWGENLCGLVRWLLTGLARLHAACKEGRLSSGMARKAAAVAVAAAALLVAGGARLAARRRQQRVW